MSKIPSGNLPLRVNQLDAAASDDFIYDVILEKLRAITRYLKISDVFTSYHPEIEAGVKSLLWLAIFRKHGATLGQRMLDLTYVSTWNTQTKQHELPQVSKYQKAMFLVVSVMLPWLAARLKEDSLSRQFVASHSSFFRMYALVNWIWCSLNVGNLVLFLLRGRQLHLYERILGLQSVHPKGRQLRDIGYEYSTRELLWHGFAEFMVFMTPFINLRRLQRLFKSSTGVSSNDSTYCKLCDKQPTNPQQIRNCDHIYCYHCVVEIIYSDGFYECSECQVKITTYDELDPAYSKVT